MFELTTAEKLLFSLLLIATLSGVRVALIRLIRKESLFITQQQRRWINFAKNAVFVLIVVGLVVLWNAELRHFVLSITAFIIALIEKRAGIDIAGPDPRVWIGTHNDGKVQFATTLFCPTSEAVGIEQKVVRDVLELLRSPPHAAPPPAAKG